MKQHGDLARPFTDPDASGAIASLAAYLQEVGGVLAERKRASIDAMALQRGDAALDVGCGTGDEVRLLAERVGRSGRSVGVDLSEKLLAIARERTPPDVGAEFVAADAHALPFGDGEFAAARVERTLLHVAAPARVVQEVARVVRIGGRVVALEIDWDTLVISSDDAETTREILDAQRAGIRPSGERWRGTSSTPGSCPTV